MKPRSSRALRNLGTIIRTADWFGVRRIVCSNGTVSCFIPKVEQSTMGSLFRTDVLYADLPSYSRCGSPVRRAEPLGLPVAPPFAPSLSSGSVLVVGNEGRGLTPQVRECVTHPVTIPNLGGTAESLNAAVACAILMAQMLQKP